MDFLYVTGEKIGKVYKLPEDCFRGGFWSREESQNGETELFHTMIGLEQEPFSVIGPSAWSCAEI